MRSLVSSRRRVDHTPEGLRRLPFHPVAVGEGPISDPRLPELIRWGQLFDQMGLAPSYGSGSHGNLSLRKGEGCLITGTQTFLGALTGSDFVEIVGCDLASRPPVVWYRGSRRPSTDSLIHWHLYQWRSDVQSVLHAHDAVVLRCAQTLGLPQTAQGADAGSLRIVEFIRPLVHHPYFLIRGHGFVSVGQTIEEAGEKAVSIHRQAQAQSFSP